MEVWPRRLGGSRSDCSAFQVQVLGVTVSLMHVGRRRQKHRLWGAQVSCYLPNGQKPVQVQGRRQQSDATCAFTYAQSVSGPHLFSTATFLHPYALRVPSPARPILQASKHPVLHIPHFYQNPWTPNVLPNLQPFGWFPVIVRYFMFSNRETQKTNHSAIEYWGFGYWQL